MSVTQTLDSANQLPLPSEYEPRCHLPWMMMFLLLFFTFLLEPEFVWLLIRLWTRDLCR